MALIPPFFLDCVVAIGFGNPDGSRHYVATGFLYGRLLAQEDERKTYKIVLVTNKHVLQDAQVAWLRFNPKDDEPAQEFLISLFDENKNKKWIEHPDPEIDLAAIGIKAAFLKEQGINVRFFRSDQHVLNRAQALEQGVSEGDGVFVLGFPMGLIGEERNFVIVRQGAIARIRDTLTGSSKEFLIDTSIFSGNSGGPVVSRPEFVAIDGTKAIPRSCLLGVVSSYLTYEDVAISTQTRKPRIIFEENSGLAAVVPIDYLTEIIDVAMATSQTTQEQPSIEVPQSAPEEPAS